MSLSFFLRPLLPTWRFFEDVGPAAALSYRSGATSENLGAWTVFSGKPLTRHFGSLFLNPEGNLRLAERALIERLSQGAEPVSYQLVKSLVQSKIPNGFHFQFRVTLGGDEVIVSTIHRSFEETVE
jgi:hypothetical protein